jgi:primosomal protein N' (replication factor Y)
LLLRWLAETLAAGEQAILFLNRRGSATFVQCRACGHVATCPRCGVPLTFHAAGADLVCHHCNHREAPPAMCPVCASGRIRFFGAGTQRVEAVVREHFPEARVLRWDADTAGGAGGHEALLRSFVAREADVLVGTQMVAKGLDLPGVTLVGVVLADTALALPDFRAAERTFQLLAQVAGRAGRMGQGGRVVFQTYRPEEPAILAAARHDAPAFYRQELAFRARHRYPPFARLLRLDYHGASDRAAEQATRRLAARLRAEIERLGLAATDLVGPAPAFFKQRRGRVRWQLVIRGPDPAAALAGLSLGPGWVLDVDPVAVL